MPTNDIKPFASAGGANVLTQAEYLALAALSTGFSSGKASSKEVNKAIRQATFIASVLAQFICDKSGSDVLDDGNVAGLVTKLISAMNNTSQPLDDTLTALAGLVGAANKLPYFNGDDTAALTDLTSVGRDIIGKTDIAAVLQYLGITQALALKAPLASPSFSGTPSVPTAGQAEIDFRIANTAFVAQAIADLNGGAPAVLNTLKKLASAINNDANFYSTVNSALGQKASLSDFTSSKTSTSVVGNQPGGLRFMCGYITVPTDSNGNIFITLPDTFLGGVVYCEAHQCGSSYVGDNSPFVFSSYQPASGPTSSISFAVRATTTGAPLINDSIQLMYFVRGY
ncbi:hypothetical protein RNF46_003168 [Citrobacter freundii]|uniref:hypothetical protein n=1 Tax=Citrobacter sp. Cpo073 TaxID=2985134 RepID=UPI00257880C3|nr:hypothetical protein [Citrobacter sp. Cpo073]ELF4153193.1 hypothetical protein [Citrobacter freundii]MDM2863167.1 hypothetical protein [Citrobacter sp. Cpo073]